MYANDTLGNLRFVGTSFTKEAFKSPDGDPSLVNEEELFAITLTMISIFIGGVLLVAITIGRMKKPAAQIPSKKPIKKNQKEGV